MIKLHQGDSSDIIILENTNKISILDKSWQAKLIVLSSENMIIPLLEKRFSKDIEMDVFFTMLMPRETIKLIPGRYVIGFQISNEELCFRREIKDKLLVKSQAIWDKDKDEYYGSLPAFCKYTSDGSLPEGNQIILKQRTK